MVWTHGHAFMGKKFQSWVFISKNNCIKGNFLTSRLMNKMHEYFPRFYILGTLMKIKTGSTIFYFPPTALKLAFCKVKKEFAEENGIRQSAPAPPPPVQTPFQTPG